VGVEMTNDQIPMTNDRTLSALISAEGAEPVDLLSITVHSYLDIVLDEVYRVKVIQEDLGDIEEFCQGVIGYVERVAE